MTGPRRGRFLPPARPGTEHHLQRDAERVLSYPVEHGYIVPRPLKSMGRCKGVVYTTGARVRARQTRRRSPPTAGRSGSSSCTASPDRREPCGRGRSIWPRPGSPSGRRCWPGTAGPGRTWPRPAGPTGTPPPERAFAELSRPVRAGVRGRDLDGRLPGVPAGGDQGRRGVSGLVVVNPSLAADNPLIPFAPVLKYVIRAVPSIGGDIKKPGRGRGGGRRGRPSRRWRRCPRCGRQRRPRWPR